MKEYSDEQLLIGILNHDNLTLQYIYKKFFHTVNQYILKNSGSEDDANDIFQEAIIVIYRKVKEDDLGIKAASFQGYLYSVCRFLWLKQLERRKIEQTKINEALPFIENIYDDNLIELINKNEKYSLYQRHFKDLGADCRKLLQLFFNKVSYVDIAKIMGYKSDKYVKKRKYQCKELLVSRIKKDILYKKIIENDT